MSAEKLNEYAKALVALAGAIAVTVTAVAEGLGDLQGAVTALVGVLTAAGVYRVPNREPEPRD